MQRLFVGALVGATSWGPSGWPKCGGHFQQSWRKLALPDIAIRHAKPREKPYKLGDALGFFLLVQPTGGTLWRLKYRVDGREKKLGFGAYREVSLAEARKRRDDAREAIAAGKDPSQDKQRSKTRARLDANNTFASISGEYCKKRRRDGVKAWASATTASPTSQKSTPENQASARGSGPLATRSRYSPQRAPHSPDFTPPRGRLLHHR